jgi:hypothetical protein
MGLLGPNISKMRERKDIIGLLKVLKGGSQQRQSEAADALAAIGKAAVQPLMNSAARRPHWWRAFHRHPSDPIVTLASPTRSHQTADS